MYHKLKYFDVNYWCGILRGGLNKLKTLTVFLTVFLFLFYYLVLLIKLLYIYF